MDACGLALATLFHIYMPNQQVIQNGVKLSSDSELNGEVSIQTDSLKRSTLLPLVPYKRDAHEIMRSYMCEAFASS
jgi:hypothetical protein